MVLRVLGLLAVLFHLLLAAPAARSEGRLIVNGNELIIQFKRGTRKQLISALFRKFDLKQLSADRELDLFRVTPRRSSRGGSSRKASRVEKLRQALEPDVLRRIRSEPIVNAAIVQTLISSTQLPRMSNTSVLVGKRRFDWTWRPDIRNDGNWGLKRMRLPAVWHVLKRLRAEDTAAQRPVMAFVDTGFGWHDHLAYNRIYGLERGEKPLASSATCDQSHGTHVAGIAGAAHGLGRGIDGIVPDAQVDAVPITDQAFFVGIEEGIVASADQRAVLFIGALRTLVRYLRETSAQPGRKRVINISLGFNWHATGAEIEEGDLVDSAAKTHVLMAALMLQQTLQEFEDSTLFVVSAGNDSPGLRMPLNAKWSSPFAYLGLAKTGFRRAPNVIVVEAVDRSGRRAEFSNVGGHVSAPGTEIMSTLSGRRRTYGVCSGTSQAAPHVAALAAILMEAAPGLSPARIASVIRASAVPSPEKDAAPRADALNAMIRVRPDALRRLADLNSDNRVDSDDLATFRLHRAALTTVFRSTNGRYFFDLNGNGAIEDNEHWFPRIDLNGSGVAGETDDDLRCINGQPVSDLDVLRLAWTDNRVSFSSAVEELGLQTGRSRIRSSTRRLARVETDGAGAGTRSRIELQPDTGCRW